MSLWFDPVTGQPFWKGTGPMWTRATSLCCACRWTWTATCTAPSGSWTVTGPTKACVPYTGRGDSTGWEDCTVAGSTITMKWYKFTLLDGCCTGDCENHTEPDFTPDPPTKACGCTCPTNCDACPDVFMVHLPARNERVDCFSNYDGTSAGHWVNCPALDIEVTRSGCSWGSGWTPPLLIPVTTRHYSAAEDCTGPYTELTQNVLSGVALLCTAGVWNISVNSWGMKLYTKALSDCPDGDYSEGASVE